jgi:hypothetical protein
MIFPVVVKPSFSTVLRVKRTLLPLIFSDFDDRFRPEAVIRVGEFSRAAGPYETP